MARLRIETAPEITVFDEAFIVKAAANATAPLIQFQNASGNVGNISASGVLTVASVIASSAGTSPTDLATRAYVDSIASNINWHEAVGVATAAALPSSIYDNGATGVGAYLEASTNGALPAIDGITLVAGSGLLVKNQADARQNGIYTVQVIGNGSTKWRLVRRSDSNNSIARQVAPGDSVFALEGTTNGQAGFALSTAGTGDTGAIIIGTDNIQWTIFAGAATTIAGNGISRAGQVISVLPETNKGITVTANGVGLSTVTASNSSGSTTTSFLSNISVDVYGRVENKEFSSVSFTGYATLAGPTFTAVPNAPTAAAGTSTTQIATTDFVTTADNLKAPLASPTFTGTPTLPTGTIATTQTAADSSTKLATTEFVTTADNLKANLASPTFTGTVTLPDNTVALGTKTTGSYVESLVAGTGVTLTNNSGESATPTVTVDTTVIQARVTNVTDTEIGYLDGVTSAIQTQIDTKAPLASPTFTGVPAAPTAAAATNTTQVATTAFVRAEVAALVGSAGATLDTLGELATALGNDAALSTTLTTSIGLKAPLASPSLTGTPLSTTAAVDTNTTQIATTAYVVGQAYAKLASPTFTGTVTLPSGTVTSTMILDGTIANADISTTAAIDQGKIADTTINAQVASYTLVLTDKNKLVEISNASANTLTVPPNSSVAFPVGSTITILQTGAGQCTLTAGAGVTVNGTPGLKLRTQYSSATLIKRATDTWVALGDMVA